MKKKYELELSITENSREKEEEVMREKELEYNEKVKQLTGVITTKEDELEIARKVLSQRECQLREYQEKI